MFGAGIKESAAMVMDASCLEGLLHSSLPSDISYIFHRSLSAAPHRQGQETMHRVTPSIKVLLSVDHKNEAGERACFPGQVTSNAVLYALTMGGMRWQHC
jgi:hypothetical protein